MYTFYEPNIGECCQCSKCRMDREQSMLSGEQKSPDYGMVPDMSVAIEDPGDDTQAKQVLRCGCKLELDWGDAYTVSAYFFFCAMHREAQNTLDRYTALA